MHPLHRDGAAGSDPLVTNLVTPQAASGEHPGLCPSLGHRATNDNRSGGQVPRVLALRQGPEIQQEALPWPQGSVPWQCRPPAQPPLSMDTTSPAAGCRGNSGENQ